MLERRSFMVAGAVAAEEFGYGAGAFRTVAAEPIRYPDPSLKVVDLRFQPLILGNAAVERIATGCRFNEGRYGSATAATSYGVICRTTAF